MSNENELLHVPLRNIERNPNALRTVNEQSEAFERLVDDVRLRGVLSPITVVAATMGDGKTPKTAEGQRIFRLVDGLHRVTAAQHAGLDSIPVQVLKQSDAEVLVTQLAANAKHIETRPWQYSQHLTRILAAGDATMTCSELATKLAMSPAWLAKRLGLVNLHADIGALVDEGRITVTNAVELAKLRPQNEQLAFVSQAIEEGPQVFVSKVKARIKELRDAKRAGRDPNAKPTFQATAHYRPLGVTKATIENSNGFGSIIRATGISDPIDAAIFALKWVLQLDEQSIAEAKAKDEAREAAHKELLAKRKAERLAAKAAEANEIAAQLT